MVHNVRASTTIDRSMALIRGAVSPFLRFATLVLFVLKLLKVIRP